MKQRGGTMTVGSLRGQPQAAKPVVTRPYLQSTPIIEQRPRRCCGSGCADCPTGRRIRAARLGLPTI